MLSIVANSNPLWGSQCFTTYSFITSWYSLYLNFKGLILQEIFRKKSCCLLHILSSWRVSHRC
uniref:Uncharacterized protein n=1 Tax=Lepeophtheirus salmonis TaxID=72036 RepID=A0A0K2VF27_LEPSM